MYEIRADYDRDSIVMYQAYGVRIARPALAAQTFVPPFSFGRMTWIKPSFRWLMHRSNWGRKPGQECILRVRISRAGWEKALSLGVLTSPDSAEHESGDWETAFQAATVHVQWDTERSLRGAPLDHYSIQVGLSRHVIREFAEEWIVAIDDFTATTRKIHKLIQSGDHKAAQRLMPPERLYPTAKETARRLQMA